MDRKDPKDPMEAAAFSAAHGVRVTDTDDDLIRAARDGDYASFERLYELHRNTVYRFAYQMTHSRDEAEDATQEAFVRAFQNLHKFREQAKFTTWILRIVTNLCTDRGRMTTRRGNLEQQEATGGLEWMTIGKVVDPNENMEADRRAELVRKAVMALPAHHRNVILLRDFEEREYTEIGEILGCTVGGAKLRVLRARRALRDRLEPMLRDQEPKTK